MINVKEVETGWDLPTAPLSQGHQETIKDTHSNTSRTIAPETSVRACRSISYPSGAPSVHPSMPSYKFSMMADIPGDKLIAEYTMNDADNSRGGYQLVRIIIPVSGKMGAIIKWLQSSVNFFELTLPFGLLPLLCVLVYWSLKNDLVLSCPGWLPQSVYSENLKLAR